MNVCLRSRNVLPERVRLFPTGLRNGKGTDDHVALAGETECSQNLTDEPHRRRSFCTLQNLRVLVLPRFFSRFFANLFLAVDTLVPSHMTDM